MGSNLVTASRETENVQLGAALQLHVTISLSQFELSEEALPKQARKIKILFTSVKLFWLIDPRNGGLPTSPLLGRFCGNRIPRTIPSFSNQIFLYFKSDYSLSARGFEVFWDGTATGSSPIEFLAMLPLQWTFDNPKYLRITSLASCTISIIAGTVRSRIRDCHSVVNSKEHWN